jgi:hypothetical protein
MGYAPLNIPCRGTQATPDTIISDWLLAICEKQGVTRLLDDYGDLILKNALLLKYIEEKYPQEKNKILLWKKLHGVPT